MSQRNIFFIFFPKKYWKQSHKGEEEGNGNILYCYKVPMLLIK